MVWLNPYRLPTGEPVPSSAYVARSPAYLLWTLWGFGVSWVETRRMRRLLLGIPAIALAGMLIMLMLSAGREASSGTISAYLTEAQQAMRSEEFDRAEFCFRKLEQLAPRDTRVKYEHAQLYAQQNDYAMAATLLQTLIRDDDKTNDVKIHLELARWAIEGKLDIEDPIGFAKANLNRVLEEDPKNAYGHYFFSQLFARVGDLDNAIQHLEPVASFDSELGLKLAAYYDIRSHIANQARPGDAEKARTQAKIVIRDLQRKVHEEQTNDINIWTQLAGAHLLMKDYEQAARILQEANTRFDNPESRKFLGRIYVRWSDQVIRDNPDDMSRRMALLQKAIETAPDEPEALQRIVHIANSEGEGAAEAEEALKKSLVDGHGAAVIHFLLGTIAAGKGDMEAALRHLDQSNELNPRTAVTLNNMAFVLAHTESPDLPKALEMSNQAIRIAHDNASFLETRGQIYTRMGEFSKAIVDLEKALNRITTLSTRINVHESLATSYEKLGDPDIARLHREKAETLRAQAALENDTSNDSPGDIIPPNLENQEGAPDTDGADGNVE